ncbi:hypothetical protein KIN20_004388 [Parelaphostrongylus tenuis]|uniref:Major facilitator superfamily (MFS) profile domain-containing protein n=1 Tax=Parelaphostrongylus tenuis TaxID=148309 RepID=A0AAD5LYQ7_PARTN|nr:hypothetical protein KIN20_004388 [Parelaphostrongylus tenuis]
MRHNSTQRSPNTEEVTEWRSLIIVGIIGLVAGIQFSIYFSSLWPYLLQLDPDASESFFGWITGIYSLTQAVMSVVFGYCQNRMQQCRIPILAGLFTMFLGNLIYLLCGVNYYSPKVIMLISRAVTGSGAGVITVVRTYAVNASTVKDRSRSISLNSGSFTLGLTIGPGIQVVFAILGYPGIKLVGNLYLDMYTAPAFMCLIFNGICVFLVVIFLQQHARFFALPKYDMVPIMICIYTRYTQMMVVSNYETLGTPISMTIFGWNKQQTVLYNSLLHACFGVIGFCIYAIFVYYDVEKIMDRRISICVGLLAFVAFHLITFPWWFVPGSIPYQKEFINVNGTMIRNPDPVGCRPSFEWCKTTYQLSPQIYIVSSFLLIGPALPLITIGMNTVFSTLLGPRNQGTMQGVLVLTGSLARMIGPIAVGYLFTEFGPRPAWGMEIVFAGFCTFLWIYFYKRIVPLKLPQNLNAGDVVRNKYGFVYRF